ncbi:transcription termination factor NusA [Oenococcus kitaharae]|uniref:Transcription termination/antitermination protein NusA n=1 Tax=Oenococcus kitaharae DSM 17330 TaxID=1045004 RepID=G9WIE4_9LACO|nr:transcription termination factor NusA [Oenococcus kitaharae]EHN58956.1 NusA-like transcription termination protein [Oenococcus kitaharae DSM 17330]OEY81731.1 transcription elongation factor NusA [Oenococcus kitaharae]OEY83962.1 transcription elongation factor NusA [Oenococcus kitaharae]OEY85682.1 transcription elongation factor NusA [Oenococcus kitaharae]
MASDYRKELFSALQALQAEKGISEEDAIASLKDTLVTAYKKNFEGETNVEVDVDPEKQEFNLLQIKEVVADGDMIDPYSEIYLKDAREINSAYEVGDQIKFEINPRNFGRLAAQSGKNKSTQLIREKEKEAIHARYEGFEHEIVSARVAREDQRFLWVTMPDGQEAAMGEKDRIPGETYKVGDPIKVLINRVEDSATRGPQIYVSRTSPELVKRLFEQEVPEVYDGVVVIESIAREAGDRSKVAVRTTDPNLDPVGTLVGPRGSRVQAVVNELHGENMDIVEWVEDEAQYIANALNPAEVVDVIFNPDNDNEVTVIVPDYQLSLAIGKRGQNARLAAKLTKFKIDIKSETQAENDPQLQAILEESAKYADEDDESVDENTADDLEDETEYADAGDYFVSDDEDGQSEDADDSIDASSKDENDSDETAAAAKKDMSAQETKEAQDEFAAALNNVDFDAVLEEKEGEEKRTRTSN